MSRLQLLCLASLFAIVTAAAEDTFPTPVTSIMDSDAVMTKMESAVKPDVLAAFQKAHPVDIWVFGEDRQFPVRNNIIPAHWFENGAPQFEQFAGMARPGEFYVFQLCLVRNAGSRPIREKIVFDSLPGAVIRLVSPRAVLDQPVRANDVTPVWIGVDIPDNAPEGNYRGEISFLDPSPPEGERSGNDPVSGRLVFQIRVEGAPLKNGGTDDAWRLARLKWLDSKVGEDEGSVTRPFTPIKVDEKARTLDILGRRITIGPDGIPSQLTSYFSASNTRILPDGRDAFAEPPQLQCIVDGKQITWKEAQFPFKFSRQTPTFVDWEACREGAGLWLAIHGHLEFDGFLSLQMSVRDHEGTPVKVDDMRFVVKWKTDAAKYAMGLGLQGGPCPDKHNWKWDVSKHQDAIWLGDVNAGIMMRFKDHSNFRRPLINAYYDFRQLKLPESWGSGSIQIENASHGATLTANCGPKRVGMDEKDCAPLNLDIDWYVTPFKPIDVRQHFADRYYHANQGAPLEDTAALKKEGVNVLEIHHNRLCNPYINYPYNGDSLPHLREFVKKAHADGIRANLYYTTRELTQNVPEFFALKSMAGEIILPRREGVAWPVTNGGGPHPWLKEHVGTDIVPAWRENLNFPEYKTKLDLAVITTPDSRWNNFYLEGLDYLVKNAGIDGLYIDDTALDRHSMQRARRILDADGNTGRRVNMHSWNHFNGLAKWSNSSIAFMELYPYYDGLWHGEGFDANASPEYMLVEMSGIPFGLMSELLDHPNPWHGMVFGMRTRWPWSGDPRGIWKIEDLFGIADSDYVGWWDPACPVKTDNPTIKASVFQKKGKALIALASWAPARVEVKLTIDWKSLGLAPDKVKLRAPACAGFQTEAAFTSDSAIPVEPGKGWLLIAEEGLP